MKNKITSIKFLWTLYMKRIISLSPILILLLLNTAVFAKTGDVAGKIYATDIKTYINGVEVESYAIDGKTVVIIEDITTQHIYSDELRRLTMWGLDPKYLKGGSNSYEQLPGTIIGNIYKTDIKTYTKGKEVPCYALNGKMAVAIEDLGDDKALSDIGGKYTWNPAERTISLEFMYNNPLEVGELLKEKHLNMRISEKEGVIETEFVPAPIMNGNISVVEFEEQNTIREITYQGEVIGYRYLFDKSLYDNYIDVNKISELLKDITPVQPTSEDWLAYYKIQGYDIISEFETDEYLFLYMTIHVIHGPYQYLTKISKKDGTIIHYDKQFESVSLYGQKRFDNVTIDEEKKKVYFSYDAKYVIDLETDKIEKIE